MKYIYDNDLHIHSYLSECSQIPEQNPERILQYAKDNNLKTICLTDHFWDETIPGASDWYIPQNYEHIKKALPLPQADGIHFLFGCETELTKELTLGISPKVYDELDFVVIPTTHFHMTDFTLYKEQRESPETRAKAWAEHFENILDRDLPFYKTGIAHLACTLIASDRRHWAQTLDCIDGQEMERLFAKAARKGVGIEINSDDMLYSEEEKESVLRMFRIAKYQGCKFYMGSDAHSPHALDMAKDIFLRAIDDLGLEECNKFDIKYN